MKLFKNTIVVLVVTAVGAVNALGQIRISAQAETNKDIYVGESFGYYIVIEGSNKVGEVDLQPLQPYHPQSVGNRHQTFTNIVNNKSTTTSAMIMSYSLTADQAGPARIPSVTVKVDGKTYRTNPVTVNIVQPGTTDRLDFEVTLSEQQCYVGQPIILTVKFYVTVGTDVGDFQLNIPALYSDAFEIEEADVTDPQAKPSRLHTGMTVMVSQYRVEHNNKHATLVTFSKVLIPKRPGPIAIPASSVSAAIAVGRAQSRDPFDIFGTRTQYKRFSVISKPLNLDVLPLPQEGKPSEFYGLVGQYTISASAAPTKVNVGDPITLTIKIGGSNYLKPVQWPELEQVPELANNFKIPTQKASPTIENGFKVFTQTIRANNDKVTRIPPIPLATFDVQEGKYITTRTEPIKLDVAPTKVLTSADLEGADFVPVNREIEAIKKGLSANYDDLDALKNMSFSPMAAIVHPGYVVLWGVPLIGLISSLFIKLSRHTSPEKIAARRRRQACGKAIGQLREKRVEGVPPSNRGQACLERSRGDARDTIQQNEFLVSIMKQYIGDRFDKTAGSLTPDDCYEVIKTETNDAQTAGQYRDIIATFEAGRYASIEVHIDANKIEEVIGLIRDIEKNCKK
ncbi:MAG: protein BatD [Sedimentisphaerales bacterium]|nr:protein BatD [Sedimentisphaerales bacterium]